jgi:hypothetical protein
MCTRAAAPAGAVAPAAIASTHGARRWCAAPNHLILQALQNRLRPALLLQFLDCAVIPTLHMQKAALLGDSGRLAQFWGAE